MREVTASHQEGGAVSPEGFLALKLHYYPRFTDDRDSEQGSSLPVLHSSGAIGTWSRVPAHTLLLLCGKAEQEQMWAHSGGLRQLCGHGFWGDPHFQNFAGAR